MSEHCQVDFYLLGSPQQEAGQLACKLALMAWERGHQITILAESEAQAGSLDELMWEQPPKRFLPHERLGTEDAPSDNPAPVQIVTNPPEGDADLVINLTTQPLPNAQKFRRLLEIVPHRDAERQASREKFRHYRQLGLDPKAHTIN